MLSLVSGQCCHAHWLACVERVRIGARYVHCVGRVRVGYLFVFGLVILFGLVFGLSPAVSHPARIITVLLLA